MVSDFPQFFNNHRFPQKPKFGSTVHPFHSVQAGPCAPAHHVVVRFVQSLFEGRQDWEQIYIGPLKDSHNTTTRLLCSSIFDLLHCMCHRTPHEGTMHLFYPPSPRPLSCPTPCPSQGRGGGRHLVNTNIFVTAYCVAVRVTVL